MYINICVHTYINIHTCTYTYCFHAPTHTCCALPKLSKVSSLATMYSKFSSAQSFENVCPSYAPTHTCL